MKNKKLIMPVLLAFILAGSVFFLMDGRSSITQEYNSKLLQAREAVKNDVITEGISFYKEALSIYPTEQIYLEAGNVYLDKEDLDGAKRWYEKEFAVQYPNSPKTYEFGLRVNIAREDYREAFAVYNTCVKRESVSETITKLIGSIAYEYSLSGSYTAVGPFSEENGYVAVKNEDYWGYLDKSGREAVKYMYRSADVFGRYAAVVDQKDEAYYIDASGTKKITTSYFEKDIKKFRPIQSDMVLANNGKTWDYYDAESHEKLFGGYQDATVIVDGIGAVTKDGINWALVDADGQEITGYDHKQVITDDRGIVCRGGKLFVEQDGQFWLIDTEGNKVNGDGYDAVNAFQEDSMAAVQKKGKWIFVDTKGKEKDLGRFEDAKSFSNGMAAVKKNGMWGYIDEKGNQVIDCIFYDVGPFNQSGMAFVKTSEKEWNMLSLYRYHYD